MSDLLSHDRVAPALSQPDSKLRLLQLISLLLACMIGLAAIFWGFRLWSMSNLVLHPDHDDPFQFVMTARANDFLTMANHIGLGFMVAGLITTLSSLAALQVSIFSRTVDQ